MIDKLSDFFKEIKERTSNPLLSSFTISWLICNWKIVIALISYQRSDYNALNFSGFIHYFHYHTTWASLWFWPLFSACVYTFVFPYIRNLINEFNAYMKTAGNKKIIKRTESAWVETSKYLLLRDQYRAKIDQISILINDESITTNRNTQLTSENLDLQRLSVSLKNHTIKQDEQIADLQIRTSTLAEERDEMAKRVKDLNDFIASKQQLENYESYLSGTWKGHLFNGRNYPIVISFEGNIMSIITDVNKLSFTGIISVFKVSMNTDEIEIITFNDIEGQTAIRHLILIHNLTDEYGKRTLRGHLNGITIIVKKDPE